MKHSLPSPSPLPLEFVVIYVYSPLHRVKSAFPYIATSYILSKPHFSTSTRPISTVLLHYLKKVFKFSKINSRIQHTHICDMISSSASKLISWCWCANMKPRCYKIFLEIVGLSAYI